MFKEVQGAPGYDIYDDGRVYSHKSKKFLSPSLNNNEGHGYLQVQLFVNGKRLVRKIHRLVAEHFLPNPDGLPCVNHKDENVMNNTISNLEWCTYSYNNNYGTRADRVAEKNKTSQPTMRKIRGISVSNQEIIEFISAAEAARFTGDLKHRSNIVACLNGRQKTAYGYRWEYCD